MRIVMQAREKKKSFKNFNSQTISEKLSFRKTPISKTLIAHRTRWALTGGAH